jgi:hypothetical protein
MPKWRPLPSERLANEQANKLDDVTKQERIRQWQAVHDFVTQNNGWVVSPVDYRRVRIEVLENSDLDKKLTDAGYNVQYRGTGMRTTGCSSAAFSAVSIYELALS